MPSVAIIGAGISGLTAAYELKKAGWQVRILESSDRIGGAIQSQLDKGFLIEGGPNTMMVHSQETLDFLVEIGLEDTILEPNSTSNKRFIVRNGKPQAIPMSPLSAITTPLFSPAGKLRLLGDVFVRKSNNLVEESVAAFVSRRVGPEFLDYAINPFVGGIFAGDPKRLSLQHAFPRMAALEKEHGSLILGAIAKMRSKRAAKKAGTPSFKPRMLSFQNGMHMLPTALEKKLSENITRGVELKEIKKSNQWNLSWSYKDGYENDHFDHVIVTAPAFKIEKLPLPAQLKKDLSVLSEIPHPPVSSLYLGYRREQVKHPLDGFGVLIPEVEKRKVLGALFSSSLFENRAPEGHVGLTVFIGGSRQPDLAKKPKETLTEIAHNDLKNLLDLSGAPQFVKHTYWPQAIPQYTLGYDRYLNAIAQAEKEFSELHFIGNYRNGISVAQCLENGRKCGIEIADSIGR
ncbi:protoporphyrinogen oxidase [Rubellicoccus peritrichatus]|uniref:Coproporphyrinogen III oxidase n=1 Tax=Rubellicoccus peritrichatus TaxID=3080537 RepID=A0AAQ3QRU2_9BACT|nr:protoporphyrinogen oxidase [Puniceicoccus sp. CR14]WOO39631.1 protoporphyrinogen oxidase [Puniceicoccus sp. CR14]